VIQRSGRKLLDHTTRFLTLLEYQSCPEMPQGSCEVSNDGVQAVVAPCLTEQLPTGQVAASIDVEPATIACREGLFANMVRELASNAVKFARADTSIAIRGRVLGPRYVLEVENAGRPFPLDRMQDVAAFQQFDRDRMEQQGLGIGLAIVNHAARLTGANLNVENLPGGSVRASLALPRVA
jgi:two-component system, sensor histidine kinase and response regulator